MPNRRDLTVKDSTMGTIPHFLGFPTDEQIRNIDRAGRRILGQIGIKIPEPRYLELLADAGARVDTDAQRVFFDDAFLEDMLSTAPSQFTLHSRDGRHDVHLGSGTVHFANGGRVFRMLDLGTGGYRRTMLRDVAHTAALVNDLDNIDFYIIACQAHELSEDEYHLNDFYNAFNNTTKHVMGGVDSLRGAEQAWELACILSGGEDELREKPVMSVITNPISPLTIEVRTLEILQFCCAKGIPATCAPAPISGATAPATLAGTLAQMHAEALAGAALSQVFCRGAKVLYGAVPTTMDLRFMDFTMGSVEMGMMSAAAVKLAKLRNLPIYGSAGVTESKRPDIQAGTEKAISCLLAASAGADVIHLSAGMLDSGNSIAYEQYVIDDEIIGMIRRVVRGFDVNDETLAVNVIDQVGPGGNFVAEMHTVDHMMDEFFYPNLAVRCNFDIWEQRGRPDMLSRARERAQQIIDDSAEGLLESADIVRIKELFPHLKIVKPWDAAGNPQ